MLTFNSNLKIVFAGTSAFGIPSLKALLASQHEVYAVLTQKDKPQGRGQKLTPNPIKQFSLQHGLRIINNVDVQPDLIIVISYGLLLPKFILDLPKFGCINVHASLLPRWRGAAPIQRAIEAGDAETGISIMQMTAGLDQGPVYLQVKTPIDPQDTSQTLHDRLAAMGANALLKINGVPKPQDDSQTTYAHKINKTDGLLNWQLSAEILERKIRAFNPWPVAYSYLDKQPIRIWKSIVGASGQSPSPGTIVNLHKDSIEVSTDNGTLHLLEIQLPGKRICAVRDILNAHNQLFKVGKQFETI